MSLHGQCCRLCKYWQLYVNTSPFKFNLPETTPVKIDLEEKNPFMVDVKIERSDWGSCQRRSPVAYINNQISQGVFPSTHRDQWCGEFEVSPYSEFGKNLQELVADYPDFFPKTSLARIDILIRSLRQIGVITVAHWLMLGDFQLLRVPNLGRKSLHMINQAIAAYMEKEVN